MLLGKICISCRLQHSMNMVQNCIAMCVCSSCCSLYDIKVVTNHLIDPCCMLYSNILLLGLPSDALHRDIN